MNALLLPTLAVSHAVSSPAPSSAQSEATSVILHPDPAVRNPESTDHTVHPNSHASMMSDPSSFSTSEITRRALEQQGLLHKLTDALSSPIPHGPDGEQEGDLDFEDKIVGYVSWIS